jgi:hypothetical protein
LWIKDAEIILGQAENTWNQVFLIQKSRVNTWNLDFLLNCIKNHLIKEMDVIKNLRKMKIIGKIENIAFFVIIMISSPLGVRIILFQLSDSYLQTEIIEKHLNQNTKRWKPDLFEQVIFLFKIDKNFEQAAVSLLLDVVLLNILLRFLETMHISFIID